MVRLDEVASIRHLLIAGHERVPLDGIGQCGAPGVVIDLAVTLFGVTAHSISTCATSRGVVGPLGNSTEVAQISPQRLPLGEGQRVGEAYKVLGVIVLKVGNVVLGRELFADPVVATGEQELVALTRATRYRQSSAVTGGAARSTV
ncbi:hypothetical protein D3C76_1110640 [compost metagenome]